MRPHVKRLIAHYLPDLHGLCERRNVGEAPYIEIGSYTRPFEAFSTHPRIR
jgi:hypothetical protein